MSSGLSIFISLAELSLLGFAAFYAYRYASGKMIPDDKKELYQLWVSRNGNTVKRAILVIVTLLSAAILSKLFLTG